MGKVKDSAPRKDGSLSENLETLNQRVDILEFALAAVLATAIACIFEFFNYFTKLLGPTPMAVNKQIVLILAIYLLALVMLKSNWRRLFWINGAIVGVIALVTAAILLFDKEDPRQTGPIPDPSVLEIESNDNIELANVLRADNGAGTLLAQYTGGFHNDTDPYGNGEDWYRIDLADYDWNGDFSQLQFQIAADELSGRGEMYTEVLCLRRPIASDWEDETRGQLEKLTSMILTKDYPARTILAQLSEDIDSIYLRCKSTQNDVKYRVTASCCDVISLAPAPEPPELPAPQYEIPQLEPAPVDITPEIESFELCLGDECSDALSVPYNPEDIYSFALPAEAKLSLGLESNSDARRMQLSLDNVANNVLSQGNGSDISLLAAGLHDISIGYTAGALMELANKNHSIDYSLKLDLVEYPVFETEPNDNEYPPRSATVEFDVIADQDTADYEGPDLLAIGDGNRKMFTGELRGGADEDWYVAQVTMPGRYRIVVDFNELAEGDDIEVLVKAKNNDEIQHSITYGAGNNQPLEVTLNNVASKPKIRIRISGRSQSKYYWASVEKAQ